MSFKIGKIPDLSRLNEILKYEPPSFDMGMSPPRKFDLNDEEIFTVKKAKHILENVDVSIESLFKFFNEWQSSKLKSVKRFVLSLSFILSLALVAGIDIAAIELFNLEIPEERTGVFLWTLLFILILSYSYFGYLRKNDLELHTSKLKSIKSGLNSSLELVYGLDNIIEKRSEINSVEDLLDDFSSSIDIHANGIETYAAIKFYEKELKDLERKNNWIEWIELKIIYFLGILSFLAIINSFFL